MTEIYALHGFLGLPSDWQRHLPKAHSVNLFQAPINTLKGWADQFNSGVAKESILVGYSLGGRLALHALIQDPKKWKAAVLISANPGVKDPEARAERLKQDQKWAKRFLNDPWEKLMQEWNNQAVFAGGGAVPVRLEGDYSRLVLSQVLEKWSLGSQDYLPPLINALPMPLLWITGEKDPKAASGFAFAHPKSKELRIPQAGHRVPWDNEVLFQQQLHQFLGEWL